MGGEEVAAGSYWADLREHRLPFFRSARTLWRLSVPLVHWLLLDATWHGTSRDDCKGSGACWVFVRVHPSPHQWASRT